MSIIHVCGIYRKNIYRKYTSIVVIIIHIYLLINTIFQNISHNMQNINNISIKHEIRDNIESSEIYIYINNTQNILYY